jgi:hypothetical protein
MTVRSWTTFLIAGAVLLAGNAAADVQPAAGRLAVLLAAPAPGRGETAMHNDLQAIYGVLLRRGFLPEEILSLEGSLNRTVLMPVLKEAARRIATWRRGDVFLFYSGHGSCTPNTTAFEARPGLLLASDLPDPKDGNVLWDDVFAALHVPGNVRVILLPDC